MRNCGEAGVCKLKKRRKTSGSCSSEHLFREPYVQAALKALEKAGIPQDPHVFEESIITFFNIMSSKKCSFKQLNLNKFSTQFKNLTSID